MVCLINTCLCINRNTVVVLRPSSLDARILSFTHFVTCACAPFMRSIILLYRYDDDDDDDAMRCAEDEDAGRIVCGGIGIFSVQTNVNALIPCRLCM